jgi:hypothetical protein
MGATNQSATFVFHGDNKGPLNTGTIGGDQIVNPPEKKSYSKEIIIGIIILIVGTVILKLLHVI